MKNIKYIVIVLFLFTLLSFGGNGTDSHKLFSDILKDYVRNGLVDYNSLQKDNRLEKYLDELAGINPDKIENNQDRLAFWINAYNAYTLKIIVDNYPIESIEELHSGGKIIGHVMKTTIWDKDIIVINGEETNLNHIEHEIIREEFDEPRIHFVLVCASIGCPGLRNEAFEGYKIENQLHEQSSEFFNDLSKNRFNLVSRSAELSKILSWYDTDFGDSEKEILEFVATYLPEKHREDLLKNGEEWEIDYLDYDWSLNDLKKK